MDDTQRYIQCMEEIKKRTTLISSFLNNTVSTGYNISNTEFICLQFRKILELVALSSLVANKEEFAKQHNKFATNWNARLILQDLERINPHFYPLPTEQVLDPKTGAVIATKPTGKEYLTKDEFVEIYEICGGLLHANNPYREEKDIEGIKVRFPIWYMKLINLLSHHQIQLIDDKTQIWVIMNATEDNKVQYAVMQRIDNQ